MNERITRVIDDLATASNAVMLYKTSRINKISRRVSQQPGKYWKSTAFTMGTDVADGMMARAGHLHPILNKLRFRESTFGKHGDPISDKLFGYMVLRRCMKTGVVPKTLGWMSLN